MDPALQPLLRADPLNGAVASGLHDLELALGHQFRDQGLLIQAITHSGAAHGRAGAIDNERLEFLGDRVLGLVVAEALIDRFPEAREGELGPRLAALVGREALAKIALAIDLGAYLVVAPADAVGGARGRPKMLADACEAVIAALYLDGGLDAARRFILSAWESQIGALAAKPLEPKTALQEWAQGRGRPLPFYRVTRSEGEAHQPLFEVEVTVKGLEPALAVGPSKRAAEKAAALALLRRLGVAPGDAA